MKQPHAYQKEGAAFLANGGSLLADEAGLGKLHPRDCKVLTPKGWREMGTLLIGNRADGFGRQAH